MTTTDFETSFAILTGNRPFPWQTALWERMVNDPPDDWPAAIDIPTGLGKTSVVAIWLLAWAASKQRLPRRLVYVVNRRTVVDQTTNEVMRIRKNLSRLPLPGPQSLGISTLRGQFADNHEWSSDPSRPAVVCGTVDMIGSRLLFGGYRIGFKSRPLHAGFLGQDALLVHDEAHLEPAFQRLIECIQHEQDCAETTGALPWPKLRVMALTATRRSDDRRNGSTNDVFNLTDVERNVPDSVPENAPQPVQQVWRRLTASKPICFHALAQDKAADRVLQLALLRRDSGKAVIIFMQRVEDVQSVSDGLAKEKQSVASLTGTMRGYEREQLLRTSGIFKRFLPPSDESTAETVDGTVYLVCTSAGEVGIDLAADDMICDLSTFDSMTQRLGRVNRRGGCDDTRVDVVYPREFHSKNKSDTEPELQRRRERTLNLLRQLKDEDASPLNLLKLPPAERAAAFAPDPEILTATDILFDAWAMTSISQPMPGRPPLEPYLHGVQAWEPPHTAVAWREEVAVITKELVGREGDALPRELLELFPLKPHELLKDRSDRVHKQLELALKQRQGADAPVWVVGDDGFLNVTTLRDVLGGDRKRAIARIEDATLLLPPSLGALSSQGFLDGKAEYDPAHPDRYDVAEEWRNEYGNPWRSRTWDNDASPEGMALMQVIDLNPAADESTMPDETEDNAMARRERRFWRWYVRPREAEEATTAALRPVRLSEHTEAVVAFARRLGENLELPEELKQALVLAASFHDLGKRRELWQRSIGNPNPSEWYAKPGKPDGKPNWRPMPITKYRHEFGALLDIMDPDQEYFEKLRAVPAEMQDVVLHLVAAHHGWTRPHFPIEAICDPNHPPQLADEVAVEAMRRYARLQRRYGRWGLAYLESLLRAADWSASTAEAAAGADSQFAEALR